MQSAGRAGTAYMGDFSGHLTVEVPLVSFDSAINSYNLSLYYNSATAACNFTGGAENEGFGLHTKGYYWLCGTGWKLSAQQTLYELELADFNNTTTKYIIYNDSDGTEHYFKYDSAKGKYFDEDGLNLQISKSGVTYTMQECPSDDAGANNSNFAKNVFYRGYLTEIHDNNDNAIYFLYNGEAYDPNSTAWKPNADSGQNLTEIIQKNKDASEETIATFTYYSGAHYLATVKDYADRVISFSYDSSSPKRLTQITWPDGQTTSYGYDSSHYRMNKLKDNECGYGLDLTYRYYNNSRVVNQVTEFTQSGNSTKLLGNSFHAYHHSRQMMEYRFYGADHTRDTDDDIVSRYTFDYGGHTINAVNLDTNKIKTFGVSTSSFTKSSGTSAKNHRMTGAAASGITAVNLLENTGAEKLNSAQSSGTLAWTASYSASCNALAAGEYTRNGVTVSPHTGSELFKLYTNSSSSTSKIYQAVYLEAGKTYTFSAHVNTMTEIEDNFLSGGAFLAICDNSHASQRKSKYVNYPTANNIDGGWERISVTYTPITPGTYYACLGIECCQNIVAAFDDVQLEEYESKSTANLLQVGSFERRTASSPSTSDTMSFWQNNYGNNVAVSDQASHGSYGMRIWGNPASLRRAYQDIPIQKDCNNTWLLSGWAKADSIANTQADPDDADAPDDRFFGLLATIYYSNGSTENHYVPFCDDYTDWQYTCGIVSPKKSNDDEGNANLKITKIRVYTAYDYNCNTAWFDDISLRAEPVETYKYDKDGKLTAVNATKNSKDSYTYNGPDLAQATEDVTGTYTYHYDSKHNMDKATTNSNNTLDVTYDARGNAKSSKWYVTNHSNNQYLQTGTTYSADGNKVSTQTDSNGIITKTKYHTTTPDTGRVSSTCTITPGRDNILDTIDDVIVGNETCYEYYANGNICKAEQDDVIEAHYSYNNGLLNAISRISYTRNPHSFVLQNGVGDEQWQSYKFASDSFGNPLSISVSGSSDTNLSNTAGDITLVRYTYEADVNNGRLAEMTYGNDYSISYTYDKFDRVTKQENSDNTEYRYYYNSEGALARQESVNAAETVDEAYDYEYDSLGRLIRSRQTRIDSVGTNSEEETVQSTQHMYDEENRITSQSYSFGERTYTANYSYNDNVPSNSDVVKDGSLHSVNYATLGRTETLSYDSLKHLQSASVDRMYQRNYSYRAINDLQSSNQVSTLSYAANSSSLSPLSFAYTYDLRGNISSVKKNGATVAAYTYDGQNQLETETYDSETYHYIYDTAGNLLGIDVSGIPYKSFSYGNSNWKDLLTEVTANGSTKKIYYQGQTYNAATNTVSGAPKSGNPLNWYNGTEYTGLTWGKDRQLTSITTGGMTADYAYDMNGIRRSKTVGTEQHSYLTQNGQVVRETIGTGSTAKVLDFVYDNNGQPFALCYSTDGGETFLDYFYITNMQGDVVRLVNYAGTTVADYSYDAWGNLLSVKNASGAVITDPNSIANLNPLRYRSYYYDTETGFYYLQSRYYDPAVGRFINADMPEYSATGALDDSNLFAYCGNNPTQREDEDGECWNIVIGALVGATVGAVSAAYASYKATGSINATSVIIGAAAGAVGGAISATGLCAAGQAIASGLISAGTNIANQVFVEKKKWHEVDKWDAVIDGVISVGCSFIGSAVTKKASEAAKRVIKKGINRVASGLDRYNAGSRYFKGAFKRGMSLIRVGVRNLHYVQGKASVIGSTLNGLGSMIKSCFKYR